MGLSIPFDEFQDLPALILCESERVVTYGDLESEIKNVSQTLQQERKSLVVCLVGNDVASITSYLGASASGHAVFLLDSKMEALHRKALFDRYIPEWILLPAESVDKSPPPEHSDMLSAYRPFYKTPSGILIFKSRVSASSPPVHSSLSLLLPTSGTTGSPKLVRLSSRNVESNAQSIADYLDISSDERPVLALPIHYSFGLSILNSHLIRGACLLLSGRRVLEREFWDVFKKLKGTSFSGVPYAYQILDKIGFERFVPPTLRTMTQAGGKLPEPLVRKFSKLMEENRGCFFVMYGQTEATARIAFVPPDRLKDKIGSAGVAIPGGRIWIENSGSGSTGEVVYSGDNVMMGYAESREDLGRGDDLKGVLRTGDLGYLDQDGFLFLTGRNKRIAKVYGLRINLDEIEKKALELGGRLGPSVAVFSNDQIVFYCELGNEEDFRQIREQLATLYRLNHNTFDFRHIDALPLTAAGKVDYRALGEN